MFLIKNMNSLLYFICSKTKVKPKDTHKTKDKKETKDKTYIKPIDKNIERLRDPFVKYV